MKQLRIATMTILQHKFRCGGHLPFWLEDFPYSLRGGGYLRACANFASGPKFCKGGAKNSHHQSVQSRVEDPRMKLLNMKLTVGGIGFSVQLSWGGNGIQ